MSTPRRYMEQAVQSALAEVNQGNTSIHGTSRKYGIPLTSFYDRLSGKVTHSTWGIPIKLSTDQEQELIDYVMQRAELGIWFTK